MRVHGQNIGSTSVASMLVCCELRSCARRTGWLTGADILASLAPRAGQSRERVCARGCVRAAKPGNEVLAHRVCGLPAVGCRVTVEAPQLLYPPFSSVVSM